MPEPTSKFAAFITELRQRRVFRVAAFYGGIAFVIFQIIDSIFEPLHIPEWVGSLLIVLLLVGFPFAIGLAWTFDITEQGIVRAKGRPANADRKAVPLIGNRALALIAVVAVAFGIWGVSRQPGPANQIASLAVLPLDNLMNDPDQDYFVDGMHEALISTLSRIEALKVISRTSTLGYRNTTKKMPEIAGELGVDAIVEGSVLKVGNRVRITAQLIRGDNDEHLWSANYERDLADVLALQNEVATAIAAEIQVSLTRDDKMRLSQSVKVSPEAHEHYLKGVYHWNRRTEEGFDQALEHFQAAVELAPDYAPAHAGLASTYELMGEYSLWPADVAYPKAIAAAEEALRLDEELAEAHTALAASRLYYLYDWEGAERGYQRAIALNPGYATAYQWLAELSFFLGRHDKALTYIEQALSINPFSKVMLMVRADILTFMGRFDEAIAQYAEWQKLYPGVGPNTTWYVWGLVQAGRFDEAVELDLKILRHYADPDGSDAAKLQATYDTGGFDAYAKQWIALMGNWNTEGAWMLTIPWRHALSGNVESTLSALEVDYLQRGGLIPALAVFQDYRFLHDEPRFKALLIKIGLAP